MARTFLTIDEALALAFPGCEVERSSIMLTEAQSLEIEALAGAKLRSTSVHPYRATCDGEPGGLALIDTHRVRTLPETLMIAIDADGQVRRVEILAFREPAEYIPPALWYAQFDG
ncbi:MAG: FMN-binding protein, partial [Acidobacteriota bacterium]